MKRKHILYLLLIAAGIACSSCASRRCDCSEWSYSSHAQQNNMEQQV